MRLGVISDTHISDRYETLPAPLILELKKVDLIIHAGDFTSFDFFTWLKTINAVKGVLGNLDSAELQHHLKEKEIIKIQNFKIGIMHGSGRGSGILENVKKSFDASFDLVIFGHSHEAFLENSGKTTYLNPGSPTDIIFSPYNSYGMIEITDKINAKIVRL